MRVLSLFAGIGGFDLAAQWCGWDIAGQVEIDPFCQRVLAKHWPDVPRVSDIHDVKGDEFGAVDVVCGGFPCQPWSVAGKQAGTDDPRHLWPEMRRVIAAVRPRYVVAENVPGIIRMGLDRVLDELEALGYACWAAVVPAAGVGALHRRDRVWIVGRRTDADGHSDGERRDNRRVPDGGHGASLLESPEGRQSPRDGCGANLADAARELPHGTELAGRQGWRSESSDRHSGTPLADATSGKDDRRDGGSVDCRAVHGRRQHAAAEPCREDVADAHGAGRQEHGRPEPVGAQLGPAERRRSAGEHGPEAESGVCEQADGLPGFLAGPGLSDPLAVFGRGWEYGVPLTVSERVPDRVNRLKALGNAVVPAIPYVIFQAIDAAEREERA